MTLIQPVGSKRARTSGIFRRQSFPRIDVDPTTIQWSLVSAPVVPPQQAKQRHRTHTLVDRRTQRSIDTCFPRTPDQTIMPGSNSFSTRHNNNSSTGPVNGDTALPLVTAMPTSTDVSQQVSQNDALTSPCRLLSPVRLPLERRPPPQPPPGAIGAAAAAESGSEDADHGSITSTPECGDSEPRGATR